MPIRVNVARYWRDHEDGALSIVIAASSLVAFFWLLQFDPLHRNSFIDVDVYQAAARHLVTDGNLYGSAVAETGLQFNYPVIAAVLFVPLLPFGPGALHVVFSITNFLLLWGAIALVSRQSTLKRKWYDPTVILWASLILWLEPVAWGAVVGQVNTFLLVLLLVDAFIMGRLWQGRFQGILTGLAAAIKLYPAALLLYFVASRRWLSIVRGVATFVLLSALGFIISGSQAMTYWTTVAGDVSRIGNSEDRNDQSLVGALFRISHLQVHPWPWGIVIATLILSAAVLAAGRLMELSQPVVAFSLLGAAGTASLPFSWTHQWVWIVPIAVEILMKGSTKQAAFFWIVFGAWPLGYATLDRLGPIMGLIGLPIVEPWAWLYGNFYVWFTLGAIAFTLIRFGLPNLNVRFAQIDRAALTR